MRGPLFATLAAIAPLSGCVQPRPNEPAAARTSEASPTAVVPPAPPPSPVEADKSQSPTPAPPAPPKETARNTPSNPPPAGRSAPNATPSPPQASSTPAKPPVAAAAPAEAPASQPLDLDGLEQRLRDTHAIGVFTKLSLKNQVNDLLGQFREFHEGQIKVPLADLRQRYEQLLLQVITLLQDSDAQLANTIASSREAIWHILSDPKTFAKS